MKKLLWYLPFTALYFVPKAIENYEIDSFNYIMTAIAQGVYLSTLLSLLLISIL